VNPTLGSFYALAAAATWAISVILFRRSGLLMPPLGLNMFKNVVGLALLGASLLVVGKQGAEASARDWWILLGSGAVGIGVADTLIFAALNRLGASRQALVDCFYTPAVVLSSYLALGEVLSPFDALGAGLILAALLVAVLKSPDRSVARRDLGVGAVCGAAGVVLMAIAIVAAKPILERTPVLWATTVRMLGGTGILALAALAHAGSRTAIARAFRPGPAWGAAIAGSVLGTYVALLLWIAGFKYAPAGVAAILNQTSTLFIVVLAVVFLGERLTGRLLLALVLALGGSLLVLA